MLSWRSHQRALWTPAGVLPYGLQAGGVPARRLAPPPASGRPWRTHYGQGGWAKLRMRIAQKSSEASNTIVEAAIQIVAAALANGVVPAHNVCLDLKNPHNVYGDALRARLRAMAAGTTMPPLPSQSSLPSTTLGDDTSGDGGAISSDTSIAAMMAQVCMV